MIMEGIEKRSRIPIQLIMIANDERYHIVQPASEYYKISRNDFIFAQDDIKNYFDMAGIAISSEDALRLYEYTDGWVAAVYLQQLSYRRTGDILHALSVTSSVKK